VMRGDGGALYVFRLGEMPARVFKVDIATGKRELWREIGLQDPSGVAGLTGFLVTPDGGAYAYEYAQHFSELYLVEGLK